MLRLLSQAQRGYQFRKVKSLRPPAQKAQTHSQLRLNKFSWQGDKWPCECQQWLNNVQAECATFSPPTLGHPETEVSSKSRKISIWNSKRRHVRMPSGYAKIRDGRTVSRYGRHCSPLLPYPSPPQLYQPSWDYLSSIAIKMPIWIVNMLWQDNEWLYVYHRWLNSFPTQ